jgi:TonB family protein
MIFSQHSCASARVQCWFMQAATSTTRNIGFGTAWVGQSVDGRFPLREYLGGSRNSAVFLTQIGGPEGARAVIKLVPASSCDAEAQLALWRGTVRLSHPNLIRILDGGRCWLAGNDLIFVVMEYAEENLGEVLPRRALTPAEGYAMLRPIMEALKYLHQQRLVHGHLRPSNVMAVNEELKVSSDGVRPAGEFKSSADTSIYDAPELPKGTISSAADMWSLSALLTEALTPKSTRQTGAYTGLPRPFAEIVQHCLRDEPSARWTLSDVEAHLQASAHPGATAVRLPQNQSEPRQSEVGPRPQIRRFLPLALTAVLVMILAAIYAVVHSRTGPQTPTKGAASSSVTAKPSATPAQAPTPAAAPGEVLTQASPNASRNALRTIHGRIKVRVRVGVDSEGNVDSANLVTPGPSEYFARLAMQAAQQWKFTPPKENGQAVASDWTILFEYTRNGISQQADPTKQ